MAFDGFTVACLRKEFSDALTGGYLAKIIQPESDALIQKIKNNGKQYRLLLSASAALPLAYLTERNRTAPLTAPNFCMVLRKHLSNAKLIEVSQAGLDRVMRFSFEHLDEMGDIHTCVLHDMPVLLIGINSGGIVIFGLHHYVLKRY